MAMNWQRSRAGVKKKRANQVRLACSKPCSLHANESPKNTQNIPLKLKNGFYLSIVTFSSRTIRYLWTIYWANGLQPCLLTTTSKWSFRSLLNSVLRSINCFTKDSLLFNIDLILPSFCSSNQLGPSILFLILLPPCLNVIGSILLSASLALLPTSLTFYSLPILSTLLPLFGLLSTFPFTLTLESILALKFVILATCHVLTTFLSLPTTLLPLCFLFLFLLLLHSSL